MVERIPWTEINNNTRIVEIYDETGLINTYKDTLGYNDPTRKNKMDTITHVDGTEATLVPITDIKHYAITFDADGNEVRTEIPAPEVFVQGQEGTVATEYVEV